MEVYVNSVADRPVSFVGKLSAMQARVYDVFEVSHDKELKIPPKSWPQVCNH